MGLYSGIDYEACWAAYFELLKAKLGADYAIISRRHIMPPTLTPEMQPALFVTQTRVTSIPTPAGTPVKKVLNGFLILYLQVPAPMDEIPGQETQLGATELNARLRAIDDAHQPDSMSTGKLTLGGLVTHCWIEGDADVDEGIVSSQAAAILPMKMLVP